MGGHRGIGGKMDIEMEGWDISRSEMAMGRKREEMILRKTERERQG